MEQEVRFTETEEKIRKQWLFWAITLPACLITCVALIFLLFAMMYDLSILIAGIAFCLITWLSFYIAYRCAYKKPGTIFLTLTLIMIPLNILSFIFNGDNRVLIQEKMVLPLIIAVIATFYQLFVFYVSYKLLQVNKAFQKRVFFASPYYHKAVLLFSSANNSEELQAKYSQFGKDCEGKVARNAIALAYEERKAALNP